MVRFKESVRLKELSHSLVWIIQCLCNLSERHDWIPDVVVTSINDSKHMEGSKHYSNQAVDIRSHHFTDIHSKRKFLDYLKLELNQNDSLPKVNWNSFTVLLEGLGTPNEHIHIQVARGKSYP